MASTPPLFATSPRPPRRKRHRFHGREYLTLWLERHYRPFRSLGAGLVAILLAMIMSNLGLLAEDSRAYDFLFTTGVSLGITLILLSVRVSSILQAGPRLRRPPFASISRTAPPALRNEKFMNYPG